MTDVQHSDVPSPDGIVHLTLDQVLTIVGRLDDGPGFDTPRERFRRFLSGQIKDVESARSFVEQCQRSLGEQHHRALQDAIVTLGRFLGFDVVHGRYERGAAGAAGEWRSRRRLHVLLEIWHEQTPDSALETLARALAASGESTDDAGTARVGLCVVTSRRSGNGRLDAAVASARSLPIRIVSVRSLLQLCELLRTGTLGHDDVVRLLTPHVTVDWLVDLLGAVAGQSAADEAAALSLGRTASHESGQCWAAVVGAGVAPATDQFIASVIGRRQLLGINASSEADHSAQPGDRMCFFVAGSGVVGHAEIAAMLEDAAALIRYSKRFSHVVRLKNVVLYDQPIMPEPELRRTLELQSGGTGSVIVALASADFDAATHYMPGEQAAPVAPEGQRTNETLTRAGPSARTVTV